MTIPSSRTVSYTHLDVYKRQPQGIGRRALLIVGGFRGGGGDGGFARRVDGDGAVGGDVYKRQTAVRVIPVEGADVGDMVEMGGLLGSAPVMPVHEASSADFIARGGRIPAPLQSLKN